MSTDENVCIFAHFTITGVCAFRRPALYVQLQGLWAPFTKFRSQRHSGPVVAPFDGWLIRDLPPCKSLMPFDTVRQLSALATLLAT